MFGKAKGERVGKSSFQQSEMDEQDNGEREDGVGLNEGGAPMTVEAEGPPDAAAKPAHAGGPSSYGVLPRGDPNPSRLPSSDGNGKSRYNGTREEIILLE